MKRALAALAALSTLALVACSDPEPHEMDEVEQRAWARQAVEEHYDYEGELIALVDMGFSSSSNYCAAALTHEQEEGSLEEFWTDQALEDLSIIISPEDFLATLHVGYGIGCPDTFQAFLEWQGI